MILLKTISTTAITFGVSSIDFDYCFSVWAFRIPVKRETHNLVPEHYTELLENINGSKQEIVGFDHCNIYLSSCSVYRCINLLVNESRKVNGSSSSD
jgi:hypothetical protein